MSLTDQIRIRTLTRSDLDQMYRLHLTREDISDPKDAWKRTQLLEWLAFHNPYARNGEGTYYVAEVDGVIVGFEGRMPMEFAINGARRKGYYVHDTYVHPDYRKIGFWIVRALAKAIEEQSDSFFCLMGGTPLNLMIQRRMGYLELPPAAQYTKVLGLNRQISKVLKVKPLVSVVAPLAQLLLKALDVLILSKYNTPVTSINFFDSRFDTFMQEVLSQTGVSSYKNSSFLNWRYIHRPFPKEKVFGVEHKKKIKGFIVLTTKLSETERPVGIILDIMAASDDSETIAALCVAAIRFFREQRVDSISCLLSDKRYVRIFRRFLFRKSSAGQQLLLGNLEKCENEREHLTNIEHWHMTRGESDGLMLSA